MRSLRSAGFLIPAKTILVPCEWNGMHIRTHTHVRVAINENRSRHRVVYRCYCENKTNNQDGSDENQDAKKGLVPAEGTIPNRPIPPMIGN